MKDVAMRRIDTDKDMRDPKSSNIRIVQAMVALCLVSLTLFSGIVVRDELEQTPIVEVTCCPEGLHPNNANPTCPMFESNSGSKRLPLCGDATTERHVCCLGAPTTLASFRRCPDYMEPACGRHGSCASRCAYEGMYSTSMAAVYREVCVPSICSALKDHITMNSTTAPPPDSPHKPPHPPFPPPPPIQPPPVPNPPPPPQAQLSHSYVPAERPPVSFSSVCPGVTCAPTMSQCESDCFSGVEECTMHNYCVYGVYNALPSEEREIISPHHLASSCDNCSVRGPYPNGSSTPEYNECFRNHRACLEKCTGTQTSSHNLRRISPFTWDVRLNILPIIDCTRWDMTPSRCQSYCQDINERSDDPRTCVVWQWKSVNDSGVSSMCDIFEAKEASEPTDITSCNKIPSTSNVTGNVSLASFDRNVLRCAQQGCSAQCTQNVYQVIKVGFALPEQTTRFAWASRLYEVQSVSVREVEAKSSWDVQALTTDTECSFSSGERVVHSLLALSADAIVGPYCQYAFMGATASYSQDSIGVPLVSFHANSYSKISEMGGRGFVFGTASDEFDAALHTLKQLHALFQNRTATSPKKTLALVYDDDHAVSRDWVFFVERHVATAYPMLFPVVLRFAFSESIHTAREIAILCNATAISAIIVVGNAKLIDPGQTETMTTHIVRQIDEMIHPSIPVHVMNAASPHTLTIPGATERVGMLTPSLGSAVTYLPPDVGATGSGAVQLFDAVALASLASAMARGSDMTASEALHVIMGTDVNADGVLVYTANNVSDGMTKLFLGSRGVAYRAAGFDSVVQLAHGGYVAAGTWTLVHPSNTV